MENEHKISYSPSLNRFLDCDYVVIHDLHQLFDTWQLDQWIRRQEDSIMSAKDGSQVYLEYLNEEQEDDMFDFLSYQDSYGVKTDRVRY